MALITIDQLMDNIIGEINIAIPLLMIKNPANYGELIAFRDSLDDRVFQLVQNIHLEAYILLDYKNIGSPYVLKYFPTNMCGIPRVYLLFTSKKDNRNGKTSSVDKWLVIGLSL